MACITHFYDVCALCGWRWGRYEGRYGFNESLPRDFGERSQGVGLCLAQVSVRICLEDPCGGGIVCHGCALSISHPLNFRGKFMVANVHHPLLFYPLFHLGRRCARGVHLKVLCQCFQYGKCMFLHSIVARVSWKSVDNSCTCVTGVSAGAIQCCGDRLAELETR